MSNVATTASLVDATDKRIRVMLVDDAAVVRRLLSRWIDAEPDMTVVASLRTGREAVDQIERYNPDVVVLDVHMPELDGIAALPLLLKKKRDLVVIMASTQTRRGAEITLRALALGAADYIAKPLAEPEVATSAAFHRELMEKLRSLGRRRHAPPRQATAAAAAPRAPRAAEEFRLRPFAAALPRALVIGASTGGPQALTALVGAIGPLVERAPVLITQHMPATFTTVLAEHLGRVSGRNAQEAAHGGAVVAGRIYVAPGGYHMRVVRGGDGAQIELGDDPPINFCKPAVDPLLDSAARVWGAGALALILTGMGSDGARGGAAIAAAGGSVIAQDEATSVVFGMPRAVAQAGLCSAVLPLSEIAARINRLAAGDRS